MLRLASGFAVCNSFNAVVDGIPDNVNHRLCHHLDNILVHFCIGTFAKEIYFLVQLLRKISDQPFKVCHQRFNWNQADLQGCIAQAARNHFPIVRSHR